MANSYSNIHKQYKARKTKRRYLTSQQERTMIRDMLVEKLESYKVSKFLPGLTLKIDLGTINPFIPNTQCRNDTCWLKLIGTNLFGMGERSWQDSMIKIASVADPECSDKVARYIEEYHHKMLESRAKSHKEYLAAIEEYLDKYGPLAQSAKAAQ